MTTKRNQSSHQRYQGNRGTQDHAGPYSDGHYNLVIIDKRTRYPVVETVTSTNFKVNKERFKQVFATYGIPRRLTMVHFCTLNEFQEFAAQ